MTQMELKVFCVEKSFQPSMDDVRVRRVQVTCRPTDAIASVCRAVEDAVRKTVVSLHCIGIPCDWKRSVEYYCGIDCGADCGTDSGANCGTCVWLARTDIEAADESSVVDLDISTLSDELISLTIADDCKVAGVKEMIHHRAGIPASQQCLLLETRLLEDSKSLKEYGVDKLSDLSLIPRLRASGLPVFMYLEENEERWDRVVRVNLGERPSWRSVSPGLNVEGECMNPDCEIYRQVAVCKLGHGVFDYILEHAECPECGHQLAPRYCGFYKCRYRYQGIKQAGFDEYVRSEWHSVDDRFERINPMKVEMQGSWKRLMFFTLANSILPKCAVCQSEILKDECLQVGPCGDCFHHKCLSAWKASSASGGIAECPTCGQLLPY